MKKLLIAAIAIAVGSAPVSAQVQAASSDMQAAEAAAAKADERLELARQFVALSAPKEGIIDTMRAGAFQTATYYIKDEIERASAKAQVDAMFVRLAPYIAEALPNLLETYAQVYARSFTNDDLRDMIAFAQTTGGKHYLLKENLLDADPAVLTAMTDLWERLTPVMQDYRREMCAKRTAERVAAGDTKAKCPLAKGAKAATARG